MKELIVMFLLVSLVSKGQTVRTDPYRIIRDHLQSSSKNDNWDELKTIYEVGEELNSDGKTYRYKRFIELPDLIRVEFNDGTQVRVSIRNDVDDVRLPIGLIDPNKHSIHNHSNALSKPEFYNLSIKNIGDTIINDTLLYRLRIRQADAYPSILYFDAANFYLRRIDDFDPHNLDSRYFFDYRMVDGYAFPFLIKIIKFGKLRTIKLSLIRVNDRFPPDTFKAQR